MKYAKDITDLIGNTPLIRLNSISNETNNLVLAKCEFLNPNSSIKDRVGLNLIQDALNKGLIDKNTTIIEPTSGNTGIALASICAIYGLKLIITMPDSMSIERRKILTSFGAEVILTDAKLGMQGSIDEANRLKQKIKNSFIPSQFENMANPQIHQITTATEILNDCDNKVDIFINVVGTGGTISGVGKVLKQKCNTKIVAIEPKESAVISGKKPNPHKIQGIGAGFIPKTLDLDILDEVRVVSFKEAMEFKDKIAKEEGLLVGISSGANLAIAHKIALENRDKNLTIVTILCDTGERYLS